MKKLVLGAALTLIAAAPAFAQGAHHRVPRLDNVRAQAMPSIDSRAVFVDGQYAGTDPDPNVRLQLQKDYPSVIDR